MMFDVCDRREICDAPCATTKYNKWTRNQDDQERKFFTSQMYFALDQTNAPAQVTVYRFPFLSLQRDVHYAPTLHTS